MTEQPQFQPSQHVVLPAEIAKARIPAGYGRHSGHVVFQVGTAVRVSVQHLSSGKKHHVTFTAAELAEAQPR